MTENTIDVGDPDEFKLGPEWDNHDNKDDPVITYPNDVEFADPS